VKYSPGDSVITVSAAIEGARAVVSVEDTGLGIPAADVDRLFERYYRGSNVSGIVGTGVGLNLVKMVVDLHGGDIVVESAEGKGSRFTVRLSTAPPPAEDAAPADVEAAPETTEERTEARHDDGDPARAAPADPLGA
jgi:signal transduction histidine kinase